MTRLDEIRQLHGFNRWANGRMLEAAAAPATDLILYFRTNA